MSQLTEIAAFLIAVENAAQKDGSYLCYHVSSEGVMDDLPGQKDPATFTWGVGHSEESAFTEYVWLEKDGTVSTWNAEQEDILNWRDLGAYQAAVLERISVPTNPLNGETDPDGDAVGRMMGRNE